MFVFVTFNKRNRHAANTRVSYMQGCIGCCRFVSRATLRYFVSLRCFLIIRCSLTICSALSRDISTGPMPGKVAVTVFFCVAIFVLFLKVYI